MQQPNSSILFIQVLVVRCFLDMQCFAQVYFFKFVIDKDKYVVEAPFGCIYGNKSTTMRLYRLCAFAP